MYASIEIHIYPTHMLLSLRFIYNMNVLHQNLHMLICDVLFYFHPTASKILKHICVGFDDAGDPRWYQWCFKSGVKSILGKKIDACMHIFDNSLCVTCSVKKHFYPVKYCIVQVKHLWDARLGKWVKGIDSINCLITALVGEKAWFYSLRLLPFSPLFTLCIQIHRGGDNPSITDLLLQQNGTTIHVKPCQFPNRYNVT